MQLKNPTNKEVIWRLVIFVSVALVILLIILACFKKLIVGVGSLFSILLTSKVAWVIVLLVIIGLALWKFLPSASNSFKWSWKIVGWIAVTVVVGWVVITLHSRYKSDDYGSRIHHQTAGVVTYGRYFFEKGKSYSFLVNGKIPWFTQEPRNTTVFRIQKEGDAQISWTVSVTTDGFHLIEPVYMPATAYDHNYHGSDTWFTVTASESEWVNVTPELVPYGQ